MLKLGPLTLGTDIFISSNGKEDTSVVAYVVGEEKYGDPSFKLSVLMTHI